VEKAIVLIKPNDHMAKVLGYVMGKLFAAGFMCLFLDHLRLTEEQAEELYADCRDKPYFWKPKTIILSGEIVVMIWEGEDAISAIKALIGPTSVDEAMATDCIRGHLLRTFGQAEGELQTAANYVHVSKTAEEFPEQTKAVLGPELARRFTQAA